MIYDLCEGVCHYVMLYVMQHCIPQYFNIDLLNYRIAIFKYGPCDSNHVPPVSVQKLKMSGSEILMFVKLFGLLISDKVPTYDPFWCLYLKLCQLLDLCLAKSLTVHPSGSFRVIVEEFNSMYVNITKDNLKPKFHNLIHYATVFEQSGPVSLTSTKRFESEHRTLLVPAHANESRTNTALTLSIQHQLNQCYCFKAKIPLIPKIVFGRPSEVFFV